MKSEQDIKRQCRLARLQAEAFQYIPAARWRFDAAEETPPLKKAKDYAKHWEAFRREGIGLLLFGNVGTGKSYAAGCIANELMEQQASVQFVSVSMFVSRMQGAAERESLMQQLLGADLLILDDLGAERSTSYARERVFDLVSRRTLSGKPIIVTTNLSLTAMQKATELEDRRIYDRILACCVPVLFDGENFRRRKAAENLKKAAEILGGRE